MPPKMEKWLMNTDPDHFEERLNEKCSHWVKYLKKKSVDNLPRDNICATIINET